MESTQLIPLDELARRHPESLEAALVDMVESGFGALEPEIFPLRPEKSPGRLPATGAE